MELHYGTETFTLRDDLDVEILEGQIWAAGRESRWIELELEDETREVDILVTPGVPVWINKSKPVDVLDTVH